MKCDKSAMRLYAVTDREWLCGRSLYEDVEKALRGGITMLQLREKELDPESFLAEAKELRALCRQYGVPFIINDNITVAVACGADGVHVGQHDLQASQVRDIIGNNMILGVSAQTPQQALRAQREGADYLGVGAVFTTGTKKDADSVSLDTLSEICSAVTIPICAIGGISEQNILSLAGTGVDGVAVVSAIFAADDITAASKRLLKLSETL